MRNIEKIIFGLVAAALAFMLGAAAMFVLQPAFEAATFNKFRPEGAPKATYWDALWADLRVTSE